MATGKRLVFHTSALIHHFIVICMLGKVDFYASNSVTVIQVHEFSHCYFTMWTFIFQMFYLVFALICDIKEINPELIEKNSWPGHELLKSSATARDFLFNTFVFPCSFLTAALFWPVFYYDRELVFPKEMDDYIPPFINYAMHSHILVVVMLEFLLGDKKKLNVRQSLFWLGLFISAYNLLFVWTYYSTGRWIYKFFDIFNWTERVICGALLVVSLFLFFFLGTHAQELTNQYREIKKARNRNSKSPASNVRRNNIIPTKYSNYDAFANIVRKLKTLGSIDS